MVPRSGVEPGPQLRYRGALTGQSLSIWEAGQESRIFCVVEFSLKWKFQCRSWWDWESSFMEHFRLSYKHRCGLKREFVEASLEPLLYVYCKFSVHL